MNELAMKIKHAKKRGEWAELKFMAAASERGFRVTKPWGETAQYDFVVEYSESIDDRLIGSSGDRKILQPQRTPRAQRKLESEYPPFRQSRAKRVGQPEVKVPTPSASSGQALSRKKRETRMGHPHPMRRFVRVQVKSTGFKDRGGYSCSVRGSRGAYEGDPFDFVAVYVVPEDVWFIIPEEVVRGQGSVALYPGLKRSKYGKYKEKWEGMR